MMQKCKKVLIKFVWVIPKSHDDGKAEGDDLQKKKKTFSSFQAAATPMPCGGVVFKNAFSVFFAFITENWTF